MAENNNQKEVLLKVTSDTSEANSGLDAVKQKIEQATDTARELSRVDYGTMSVKELKEELDKAEMSMEQLAKSGNATEASLGVIGGRVDEINGALKGIQGQKSFETFRGSIMASTGAVEALEGAMVALGFENKEFEETVQRLMGIRAFKDGIEDVFEYGKHLKTATSGMLQSVKATKLLKVGLAGLGIGLIVTAVAYLVENWDEFKEGIYETIPQLKSVSEWVGKLTGLFQYIKPVLMGVGGAVVAYIIRPIKGVIDTIKALVKGDFAEAGKSILKTLNPVEAYKSVVDGFKKGYSNQIVKANNEKNLKIEQGNIESRARELERLKNQGKDVSKEEVELQKRKLATLKKGSEEYMEEQRRLEDMEDKLVARKNAKAIKANSDKNSAIEEANRKALEAQKKLVDEYNKYIDEAEREILEATTEARKLELMDVDAKYTERIALAEKLGKDTTALVDAQRLAEKAINDKYDKVELENAERVAKEKVEAERKAKEDALASASLRGETNILNAENVDDGTVSSINRITEARLEALRTRYEAEQALYAEDRDKVANITAKYESERTKIEEDASKARMEISNLEADHRRTNLEVTAQLLSAFANLIGEQTVAGKALAVSSAIINTYLGATAALSSGSKINPYVGIAGAAAVIVNGMASVKKIISTKVPVAGGSGSSSIGGVSTSAPASAPVINTTVLNRGETEDINSLGGNNGNTQSISPIRAYIVDKDIEKSNQKNELTDKLSTF